uniref:Uncharacterized protein n=1 Tax=Jakoba libera TaxID=143017 RepID=M4Q9V9_JAKLI|nr:hypothetical protein L048_p059 [Jakoba libera]AGH24197.1 hypothetical protein [Jakoba libera]
MSKPTLTNRLTLLQLEYLKKKSLSKSSNKNATINAIVHCAKLSSTKELLNHTKFGQYPIKDSYVQSYLTYDKHRKFLVDVNLHQGIQMTRKDLATTTLASHNSLMNRSLVLRLKSFQPGFLDENDYYADSAFFGKQLQLIACSQALLNQKTILGILINHTTSGHVVLLSDGSLAFFPESLPGVRKEHMNTYELDQLIRRMYKKVTKFEMIKFQTWQPNFIVSFKEETNFSIDKLTMQMQKKKWATSSFQQWKTFLMDVNHSTTYDFMMNFMIKHGLKTVQQQKDFLSYCQKMESFFSGRVINSQLLSFKRKEEEEEEENY